MEKLKLYNDAFLASMRTKADPLADQAIQEIFSGPYKKKFNTTLADLKYNKDPLPSDLPASVKNYFEESSQLPPWANADLMAAGADFFSRNSGDILSLLGLYSLPYCYAAANGAEVLIFSERVLNDPGKRFLETAEFLLDVMVPNAFEDRGKGIRSAQKVRLIHASVRHYILKSGNWNQQWGTPINQEDMVGTNQAFAFIILRGLRKIGKNYSSDEATAYLHLWNVIGHILGVEEKLLPDTLKEAYVLDKFISQRQFKKSEAGEKLTASLIQYIKSAAPAENIRKYISGYMRFLLGQDVADVLNISEEELPELVLNSLKRWNAFSSITGFNKGNVYKAQNLVRIQRKNLTGSLEETSQFSLPVTVTK
ncbi:oxygenase MpaB family protein [soil metagenome]